MKSSWIILLFVSIAPIAWSQDKDRKSSPATTREAKPAWHSQLQSLSWAKFIEQVPKSEQDAAGKAWLAGANERKRKINSAELTVLEKQLSSAEFAKAAYDRILAKLHCDSLSALKPPERTAHYVFALIGKVSNSGLPSFFFDRADAIDETREALALVELPNLREAYAKALAAFPPKPRMEALREVARGETEAAQRALAEWKALNRAISGAWDASEVAVGDFLRTHLKEVDLPPLPASDATRDCYRSSP